MIPLDKLLHFLACYAITLTAALFLPVAYAALIAIAVGAGKETFDYWDYGTWCLADFAADFAGVFVAVGVLMIAGVS